MIAEAFAAMFPDAEKTANGWMVVCPAHGDTEGSLHVSPGDDGRTLLTCHGGCSAEDVVGAMGLGLKDLFADEPARDGRFAPTVSKKETVRKKPRAPLGEPTEVYDYTDEDGKLLYQALRYEPKTFRQRRPDASKWSGWDYSMKGQRLVLYRLPDVLAAVKRGETVYIVEGEKDANAVQALGCVGTCNVAGAGKWSRAYSGHLNGARVVILPDVDADMRDGKPHRKGQLHAADVAFSLHGVAASVKVYEFEDSKDLSDWVEETGCGKEDLEHLIEADAVSGAEYVAKMNAWERAVKGQPEIKLAKPMLTDIKPDVSFPQFSNTDQSDIGASERLVERYGDILRYCAEMKRWFVWNGSIWRDDKMGRALALAKAVAKENTVAQLVRGDKEWKKALALEGTSRVKGALELAAVDSKVAVSAEVFDCKPDVLACPNGTVMLRTGKLVEPDPTMMLTQMAPTEYRPDAQCPEFMRFLGSIMLGREDMVNFLHIWLGYCATGQSREQKLVVAYGEGANGKGTLFDTVSDVLGPLAAEAPQGLLMAKRGDSHPTELMTVRGRRLVTASEVPDGSTFDEARLKWLTGQDKIKARGMRQDFVEWKPTHKLTIYLNNRPRVRDTSEGFWRRMLLVPFDGMFGPGRPGHDPLLRDKLAAEHEGILAWLVRGSVSWYDSGLTRPDTIMQSTADYREEEDRFGAWLSGYFLDTTAGDEQKASELFKNYSNWCDRNSEKPISLRAFGASLQRAGFSRTRKRDGTHYTRPSVAVADDAASYVTSTCTHTYARNPDLLPPSATCNTEPKTVAKEEPKQSRFDDDDDMPEDGLDF